MVFESIGRVFVVCFCELRIEDGRCLSIPTKRHFENDVMSYDAS